MKKILFFLMAALMFCGCCKHKKADQPISEITKVVNVDQAISDDNADMSAKFEDYVWYETCVQLNNFLDEEYAGVFGVSNVFQIVINKDEGHDTKVLLYAHTEHADTVEEKHGFWVEDFPLDNIEVGFEQALAFINEVNLPKPHSRYVVLRKEVGPIACNPQWIFGNSESQLYVDAITGKVSETNPAFPLGQNKWPQ